MIYKTHISELLSMNLNAVRAHLESHREKLENIKFLDLLLEHYDTGKVRGMNHGVYMFFNPHGECAYIGKTNNQNFAERLGAHFGMRPKYRGNVYLHRTLLQSRERNKNTDKSEPKSKLKLEPKDYAAMVNKMHDHSISLINVYHWEGVKDALRKSDGDPDQFENKEKRGKNIWGQEVFVGALETTLQSIYCPPTDVQKDPFLIMQERGRGKLRKRQKKIHAKAGEPLAKLIWV